MDKSELRNGGRSCLAHDVGKLNPLNSVPSMSVMSVGVLDSSS